VAKWTGNQDAQGHQLTNQRFEEFEALPLFTEEDRGRPIFVTDTDSVDFGLWVGGKVGWERQGGGGGDIYYAGTFEQEDPPTQAQIAAGRWGFWYKPSTASMFQVKNHNGDLFAVEMGLIE